MGMSTTFEASSQVFIVHKIRQKPLNSHQLMPVFCTYLVRHVGD